MIPIPTPDFFAHIIAADGVSARLPEKMSKGFLKTLSSFFNRFFRFAFMAVWGVALIQENDIKAVNLIHFSIKRSCIGGFARILVSPFM